MTKKASMTRKVPSFISCLFVLAAAVSAQAAPRPFLVVIDPGHGGADTGATVPFNGGSLSEKQVTLEIAKQVSADLMRRGIRVALTRNTDKDVPLPERTAIANKLGASVFISIHLNSSEEGEGVAEGVETYILNNSTDHSSKRLADLENSVLKDSTAIVPTAAAGTGDVALIVKDLMLDGNLGESKRLACAIQNQVVTATSTASTRYRNRGVKQALFYVLLGADMPSVLVEAGFLNNPRDRTIVTNPAAQKRISNSIAGAILEFRSGYGRSGNYSALGRCKVGEQHMSAQKTARAPRENRIIQ